MQVTETGSSMRVTASAPGKLMLFGEHAVVYGRPCLVTAVDLRIFAVTENGSRTDTPYVTVHASVADTVIRMPLTDVLTAETYPREAAFVLAAVRRIAERFRLERDLTLRTHGPQRSFGLGSSSAVTVAVVGSLNALLGLDLSPREIFQTAYAAVLDVQGKASGFDVAAAVYGGTLYYDLSREIIEPLAVPELPVVIGFSGEKVSTVNLVGAVAALRDRHPERIDTIFDLIAALTQDARDALLRQDWALLGELSQMNQGLLDSLGVNTLSLARLIFAAQAAGACGAKLSGAGGGDCMFAIADAPKLEAVRAALRAAGGEIVTLATNAPGLRLEP